MPLYKDALYDVRHIAFCALASIADALMVLLLYLAVALIFRNPLWIQHLKWQQIGIVILIGGTGAVLAEMRHLSLGSWAYADSMPIIPIVSVGISPFLQFMVLPLLVFFKLFSAQKIWNQITVKSQIVKSKIMQKELQAYSSMNAVHSHFYRTS